MSCWRNPRELRHIAFKEHRHLMFKMTPKRAILDAALRDNPVTTNVVKAATDVASGVG
jgi:hypothetical protein